MHHERIFWKGIFKKKHLTLNFSLIFCHWVFLIGTNSLPFWDKRRWPLLQLWRFHATKGAPRGPPLFFHHKNGLRIEEKNKLVSCRSSSSIFLKILCERCFKLKIENVFQVFPLKKKNCWIPTKFFGIFVSWMASSSPSMEIVVWTPAAGLRFDVLRNIQ